MVAELTDAGATSIIELAPGLIAANLATDKPSLPTFARDLLWITGVLTDLPKADRVTPIAERLRSLGSPAGALLPLCADSEPGRQLLPLANAIGKHLASALQLPLARQSQADATYVVFIDSTQVLLASPISGVSNPWPGGIARLRMPRAAPSRSTLKLDEAFQLMLDQRQRKQWLRSGMCAVDLGAAPGGWSWQLVNRGIHVTAIDNGPMKGELVTSGLMQHLRADGFTWRPPQRMDWLVCDMVAKPARVVERIAYWLDQGWCDRALFNLKLPMQRRHQAWTALRQQLLSQCGRALQISARHLYHDREEITVLAWSQAPAQPTKPAKPGKRRPAGQPLTPSQQRPVQPRQGKAQRSPKSTQPKATRSGRKARPKSRR